MNTLLFAILLLLPLGGSIASWRVGNKHPAASGWIASFAILLTFSLALFLAQPVFNNSAFSQKINFFNWLSLDALSVDAAFLWDKLSVLMTLIITGVGSLIHFYSISYMEEDFARPRYFAYLNLFIFFMLLLVLGSNLLMLFIGWEGVGLCSYLLIGFWFQNSEYAAAGKKAFIMNRIGDAGFLIGIFGLFGLAGSVDFLDIASWFSTKTAGLNNNSWLFITVAGLLLGVSGKSAQIPLYTWLPDAMAGPTPVSALIHAATMVTAGVYLMARLAFVFNAVPVLQEVLLLIAFVTAAMAGIIALFQNDLKKVLAYSTVSQLGFMFMAAASGAYWIALFHVFTHAFFKAGLFLSAGNIIHALHGEQDMQKMGGLYRKIPATFAAYLICTLAISGIYPLSGYFSKHAILETISHADYSVSLKILSLLTAVYMTRSLVLVFLGTYRGNKEVHTLPALMNIPVIILAVFAAIAGCFSKYFLGEMHAGISGLLDSAPAVVTLILTAIFLLKCKNLNYKIFQIIAYLPRNRFFVDELYQCLIVRPLYFLGAFLDKVIEKASIDMTVNSSAMLTQVSSLGLSYLHNGSLTRYAGGIVLAVCLISGLMYLI